MSKNEESPIMSFLTDSNSLLISVGMIVWVIGLYGGGGLWGLFTTGGFILTCYSSATGALKRPTTNAVPGLTLGAIMMLIPYLVSMIPVVNLFFGLIYPPFVVFGSMLIIFFAIPMALQHGNVPITSMIEKLRDTIDDKKKTEGAASTKESNSVSDESHGDAQ